MVTLHHNKAIRNMESSHPDHIFQFTSPSNSPLDMRSGGTSNWVINYSWLSNLGTLRALFCDIQRISEIPWMLTFSPISSCLINFSMHYKCCTAAFGKQICMDGCRQTWIPLLVPNLKNVNRCLLIQRFASSSVQCCS